MVFTFGFHDQDVYVGGSLASSATFQNDISQPRNAINLYFPPPELQGCPSAAAQNLSIVDTSSTWKHPKVDRSSSNK